MEKWFVMHSVHFSVGPNRRTILCAKEMSHGEEACAVCDFAWSLYENGDKKGSKDLLPKWRFSVNVIQLNKDGSIDEENQGIQIWSMGQQVFKQLLDEVTEAGSDIAHPETGRNVEVKKTGTEWDNTTYKVRCAAPSSFPDTKLFNELFDLTTIVQGITIDQQLALLGGGSAPTGDPLTQVAPAATEAAALPAVAAGGFEDTPEEAPITGPDDDGADSAVKRLRRAVDKKGNGNA